MPEEEISQEENEEGEPTSESFSREYVERLRSEAKNYRLRLRGAEKELEEVKAKIKEYEDAQKSEIERLTEERARLERELYERERIIAELNVKTKIKDEAVKMGIIDPDAAYALIDLSSIEIDDGEVKDVRRALEKLVKQKPYLLGEVGSETPPPTPGAGGQPIREISAKNIDEAMLAFLKAARPKEV